MKTTSAWGRGELKRKLTFALTIGGLSVAVRAVALGSCRGFVALVV